MTLALLRSVPNPTRTARTTVITIPANDGGQFNAHLCVPPGGTGPGMVLLQEIFGVNRYMREVADWYAQRGFVVACPDLFWRQEPGVEIDGHSEADWQRAFALYQGLDQDRAPGTVRTPFASQLRCVRRSRHLVPASRIGRGKPQRNRAVHTNQQPPAYTGSRRKSPGAGPCLARSRPAAHRGGR